jgi:hypothetical protein
VLPVPLPLGPVDGSPLPEAFALAAAALLLPCSLLTTLLTSNTELNSSFFNSASSRLEICGGLLSVTTVVSSTPEPDDESL